MKRHLLPQQLVADPAPQPGPGVGEPLGPRVQAAVLHALAHGVQVTVRLDQYFRHGEGGAGTDDTPGLTPPCAERDLCSRDVSWRRGVRAAPLPAPSPALSARPPQSTLGNYALPTRSWMRVASNLQHERKSHSWKKKQERGSVVILPRRCQRLVPSLRLPESRGLALAKDTESPAPGGAPSRITVALRRSEPQTRSKGMIPG
ncbi:hypothetical protein NDU88_002831 [Pleurodeles waltl]|uniref:Uncharacterized protein n=1 Tax=Pleurodeles waltl TaxID=8319 RepID=A0AAV7UBN4_PLEWA|nr:hypothetical protein NDU88_002831 [Pleurodeles waltl]